MNALGVSKRMAGFLFRVPAVLNRRGPSRPEEGLFTVGRPVLTPGPH